VLDFISIIARERMCTGGIYAKEANKFLLCKSGEKNIFSYYSLFFASVVNE
jgi:hypothetical protein